jgi:hypothetical protein
VDQVVCDPVALLLAEPEILGKRRPLGVVGQQVAQQQRGALNVASGLFEEAEQGLVDRPTQQHHGTPA